MRVNEAFAGVERELGKFEISLEAVLNSQDKLVADISSHLLSSAGKRLRPALFFLCAKIKRTDLENYIPVAVAIELIHSATLVHDDVVDNADFRRGLPSVNSRWGNQVSVLMGDYLFAKAFAILTQFRSLSLINIMSNVVEKMSEGEIQQLNEIFKAGLTEDIYLDRVKKKTALFISASCQSGGVVTGASEKEIKALKNYGHYLGMAFQITDDLLDFLGEADVTGKPVGNDLRYGTITLPVIYMLTKSSKGELFKQKIMEKQVDQPLLEEIVREIKNTGAYESTYHLAEGFIDQAINELKIFPEDNNRQTLELLARYILKRFY